MTTPNPASGSSSSAPSGSGESGVRVLVVEDSPEIATQVSRRFAAEGWEVRVATDGPGGVAKGALHRHSLLPREVGRMERRAAP